MRNTQQLVLACCVIAASCEAPGGDVALHVEGPFRGNGTATSPLGLADGAVASDPRFDDLKIRIDGLAKNPPAADWVNAYIKNSVSVQMASFNISGPGTVGALTAGSGMSPIDAPINALKGSSFLKLNPPGLLGGDVGDDAGLGLQLVGVSARGSNVASIFLTQEAKNADGGRITFQTQGTNGSGGERMRIMPDGNVGIGTTSPNSLLSVAGTVESTGGGFKTPGGGTLDTYFTKTYTGTASGGVTFEYNFVRIGRAVNVFFRTTGRTVTKASGVLAVGIDDADTPSFQLAGVGSLTNCSIFVSISGVVELGSLLIEANTRTEIRLDFYRANQANFPMGATVDVGGNGIGSFGSCSYQKLDAK